MTRLALGLLLVGCAEESAWQEGTPLEDALLAVEQPSVPATPSLWVSNVVVGDTVTLVVTDANPGEPLYLGYSLQGPGVGPCPPVLGGFCIGLLSPQLLNTATADANGGATFTATVPMGLSGPEISFQVIGGYGRSAYGTPVVTRIVQPDPPSPLSLCSGPVVTDPFTTADVSVNGDTLFVDVEYSGGCADHEFTMCGSGWQTSLPVQVDLGLDHNANGDACRALILETLRFDLTGLRQAYPWATPATIRLNLGRDTVDFEIP